MNFCIISLIGVGANEFLKSDIVNVFLLKTSKFLLFFKSCIEDEEIEICSSTCKHLPLVGKTLSYI